MLFRSTKDGKRFFDFLEYDNSLKSSLENLVNPKYSPKEIALDLETGNYINSSKISKPFFVKIGKIEGEKNSALNESLSLQFGFRNKFLVKDFLGIDLDLNSFYSENSYEEDSQKIYGVIFNSSLFTDKKGFNFGLRGKITKFFGGDDFEAFHDYSIEPGISYKLNLEDSSIKPYLVSHFEMVPIKLTDIKGNFALDELCSGINFSSNIKDLKLLTDFCYSHKPYESGCRGSVGLGYKNFNLDIASSFSKSNYIFCPDKSDLDIGISTQFGNLEMDANYKKNLTNYDGEKDSKNSFSLSGKISF